MRRFRQLFIFAVWWAAAWFPSSYLAYKFLGPLAWVYAAIVGLAVALFLRTGLFKKLESATTPSRIAAALIITIIAITAVLAYSVANEGISGGSDRDEEMLLAVENIQRGLSPYAAVTYLENPVNKLPGLVLLAFPFYAFVHPTAFGLFSIALLFLVFEKIARNPVRAFLGWILAAALSVATVHDVVTGGTLVANAVLVLAGLVAMRQYAGIWPAPRSVCAAVFLATVLCSRTNFLLLAPLVAADLWRSHGKRACGPLIVTTSIGVAWVSLYAYLDGFNTIGITNVFRRLETDFELPSFIFSMATAFVAIAAAVWPGKSSFWCRAAWIGFFPVAMLVFTPVVFGADILLSYASYGIIYLYFAVSAIIEPKQS